MMKNIIVFGAGEFGQSYIWHFGKNKILAVADNNSALWGGAICGHSIINPTKITEYDFDFVVICINDIRERQKQIELEKIILQLIDMGINEDKILVNLVRDLPNSARVNFVREIAQNIYSQNIIGEVAECGVFRGNFAGWLSEFFPDRKLYLFDSFQGFNDKDIQFEEDPSNWKEESVSGYIYRGDDKIALLRCVNRKNVVLKKGYIPDSFNGLENVQFCFVHLDMDIYKPTLEALRFFAPRLSSGGVIMLHDYFWPGTPGIKKAVDEFQNEANFIRVPVNDVILGSFMSVALIFR